MSSFFPDHLAELAVWGGAGDPENTVTSGAVEQAFDLSGNGRHGTATDSTGEVSESYGSSFATPAAVVLGARYDAGSSNSAEIDVMGTVGVTTALAASDQSKLIGWASAKRGV